MDHHSNQQGDSEDYFSLPLKQLLQEYGHPMLKESNANDKDKPWHNSSFQHQPSLGKAQEHGTNVNYSCQSC